MSELSEIQVAMCKVIKECGFEGLHKVKRNEFYMSRGYHAIATDREGYVIAAEPAAWSAILDGHTLTQDEYEAWAKQND